MRFDFSEMRSLSLSVGDKLAEQDGFEFFVSAISVSIVDAWSETLRCEMVQAEW